MNQGGKNERGKERREGREGGRGSRDATGGHRRVVGALGWPQCSFVLSVGEKKEERGEGKKRMEGRSEERLLEVIVLVSHIFSKKLRP